MNYSRSERFKRSFKKLPSTVQEAFYKQVQFLLQNLKHPSLRAKKHNEPTGIWQARVTRNVRFYFLIDGETYFLIDIERHKD
jgi:mRNA-degrading endonuclease RelE of RelBE toxin-antitoxin system